MARALLLDEASENFGFWLLLPKALLCGIDAVELSILANTWAARSVGILRALEMQKKHLLIKVMRKKKSLSPKAAHRYQKGQALHEVCNDVVRPPEQCQSQAATSVKLKQYSRDVCQPTQL